MRLNAVRLELNLLVEVTTFQQVHIQQMYGLSIRMLMTKLLLTQTHL
jgi:hypothetical protein